MEPVADARREVALEVQKLAEDFERDDEAAFRRTRIACWVITAVVTIIILGMIALGGDALYLGIFWLIIVGLIWAGYALSSRRQRQQTGRLRALATRWLSAGPTVSRDRGVGSGVSARDDGMEL
jgi:Flp pilus assembly protein TadB